jgi:undecaprenyl diphosphate synthase
MRQSASDRVGSSGLHVAIIMDGSGRWARGRGLARSVGHHAGVEAVRRVVDVAPDLDIGTLTLHAFSSDNWHRPPEEVAALFNIFEDYLRNEIVQWLAAGVRVTVLGRRDRIPDRLREAMANAETATRACRRLHLRLAIDYSSREAILGAATRLKMAHDLPEFAFPRALTSPRGGCAVPDVDLLIRTGGEQRLSDFLLWECAYAELYFTPVPWPDFGAEGLATAMEEFGARDRRFGRVTEPVVA